MRTDWPWNLVEGDGLRLQVLVIVLINPINSDGNTGAQVLPATLARVVFLLKPKARQLLTSWLAALPSDVLGGRAVRPLQRHLSSHVDVRHVPLGRRRALSPWLGTEATQMVVQTASV